MKVTTIIILFLVFVLYFLENNKPVVEQDLESQVKQMKSEIQDIKERVDQFSRFFILLQLLIPIAVRCQWFIGSSLFLDVVLILMLFSWRNKTIKEINPRFNGGKGATR